MGRPLRKECFEHYHMVVGSNASWQLVSGSNDHRTKWPQIGVNCHSQIVTRLINYNMLSACHSTDNCDRCLETIWYECNE